MVFLVWDHSPHLIRSYLQSTCEGNSHNIFSTPVNFAGWSWPDQCGQADSDSNPWQLLFLKWREFCHDPRWPCWSHHPGGHAGAKTVQLYSYFWNLSNSFVGCQGVSVRWPSQLDDTWKDGEGDGGSNGPSSCRWHKGSTLARVFTTHYLTRFWKQK